jgi:prepilin-type processing-associated H-X9-DG protein
VIPIFKCPSSSALNPWYDKLLGIVLDPDHAMYGITEYAYSMGYTDAFCAAPGVKPGRIPKSAQGMFNLAWGSSIRKITDGTSKTIALGDASADPKWKLCRGTKCTAADVVPDPLGEIPTAAIGWIIAEPSSTSFFNVLGPKGSIYACTIEPMNKNPVTDTFLDYGQYIADYGAFRNQPGHYCKASYEGGKHSVCNFRSDHPQYIADYGAFRNQPGHYCKASYEGGKHSVCNFRSDHPGGCNFLMADASVAFLNESIDMTAYRARSTIAAEDLNNE